ncbi:MAG: ribosome biogenesis GTP-binding protein YihA/YsxC [candidate division Zixibacteria bacterium]|nr:ribosome biogenesis GTP-binding protein YihA/YsxC [candidate division Zixibacteria bacterium]MBU1469262.1 ribosome biogenesis GTP-binding protein YihA/YsxC [candidate division Zixibacteria bacterium]MBU2626753.1 ribosome biogenesis GTP-binding protein YihA/YsxC [candidate division Zixibacteria bacterium]
MLKIKNCEYLYSVVKPKDFKAEPYPQVAFAGRSNVGKSSLLNRLVGIRNVAKVSQTPGKTRAVNFFMTDANIMFVDLPGYGYSKVSKSISRQWGKLIESYLVNNDKLRGLVHLVDSRHPPTPLDQELNEWLNENGLVYVVVLTKADKLSGNLLSKSIVEAKKSLVLTVGMEPLVFSAKTGRGKNELLSWIDSQTK